MPGGSTSPQIQRMLPASSQCRTGLGRPAEGLMHAAALSCSLLWLLAACSAALCAGSLGLEEGSLNLRPHREFDDNLLSNNTSSASSPTKKCLSIGASCSAVL